MSKKLEKKTFNIYLYDLEKSHIDKVRVWSDRKHYCDYPVIREEEDEGTSDKNTGLK